MSKRKGNQENRQYQDYGGHPACQECIVYNLIPCPVVERAYDRGIKMINCKFLRPFSESIIKAAIAKNRRDKI